MRPSPTRSLAWAGGPLGQPRADLVITHHVAALERAVLAYRNAWGRRVVVHCTARRTALLQRYEP